MDRVGEFAIPIRRILEARPIYTVVALSLGVSIYRWNANRVGYTFCAVIQTMLIKGLSLDQIPHLWIRNPPSEFYQRSTLV